MARNPARRRGAPDDRRRRRRAATAPPWQPAPGRPSGQVRAAVVLAQPAERHLHVRLPRRVRDHHGCPVRQRGPQLVLRRAVGAAVLRSDDRRAVRAGLVLRAARGRARGPPAERDPQAVRATPLPAWAYFAGLLAHCILVSIADIALIVGVGRLYGVPFPSHWPAIALTLVLGAAAFCALGVAVASVISNAEAAPAVAQLVLFPLLFLSGTYLPIHSQVLNQVTGWLPIRPFNEALTGPLSRHTGADWRHLAVLAAWNEIGAT